MILITDSLMNSFTGLLSNHAFFILAFSLLAIIFKNLRKENFLLIVTCISLALLLSDSLGQPMILEIKIGDYTVNIKPLGLPERLLSLSILICFGCQLLFYQDNNKLKILAPISGLICSLALLSLQAEQMMISVVLIELAAVFSTILIFSESNKNSFKLGLRYLIIHIFSASILIVGLSLKFSSAELAASSQLIMLSDLANLGNLELNKIAQLLILLALLIDCGTFPFSNWMVESYSSTHPYTASTLSTYISKIIIFLLAKSFIGSDLLIYIGMASMLYSGILSLATGNLRQILSYNQVGKFGMMITLIGIGGSIMQPLILYMLAYFMISGLILFLVVGKMKLDHGTDALNEILFYSKKSLFFLVVGVMSALSFPLTGGYFAKILMNQFLLLNPRLYILVTLLIIPHFIALCKFFLPYFRHQDLILTDEDQWKKSQFISLIILSLIIFVSGLGFYKLFYFNQDWFAMIGNAHELLDFLILAMIVMTFIYLTRKLLIRENVIVLDADWFIRSPGYYLLRSFLSLGLAIANKMLTLIGYGDRILRLWRIGFPRRDRSLYFVIDGFVLTLFVLFVILFL
jgi:multicomponent Na+:H+ antiporter subunit D